MIRYDVLTLISSFLENELVVCNLGFPSQELFTIKDRKQNFYMLGSMGMVSSIALGLSLNCEKTVIAIDGDGSLLMNLGSLVTIAHFKPKNLKWIVIDNGNYGSTGDQATYTNKYASLAYIANGAGIKETLELSINDDVQRILKQNIKQKGFSFIVVKVEPGNRSKGPIPHSPIYIKNRFMECIIKKNPNQVIQ